LAAGRPIGSRQLVGVFMAVPPPIRPSTHLVVAEALTAAEARMLLRDAASDVDET